PPGRRGDRTPGQYLVSGRSGLAGAVGPVPGVPQFCRAPREFAPAVASPRSHQRSWRSQGGAAVYTGDGGGLDRPRVDVESSLDVSGTAVAPAPDGLRNGTARRSWQEGAEVISCRRPEVRRDPLALKR